MNEVEKNPDCDNFKEGEASGKCWSNGHYLCKDCRYYRADFKKHGQDYIDFVHNIQSITPKITTL